MYFIGHIWAACNVNVMGKMIFLFILVHPYKAMETLLRLFNAGLRTSMWGTQVRFFSATVQRTLCAFSSASSQWLFLLH